MSKNTTPLENEIKELIRTAEAGCADAQTDLAWNYTDGRGVRKNRRLALENLQKSAELGDPKARKVLKKMESGE